MIADLWYKNAVVYSLDVDTFMDANGDGVGDFEGLIRHLDYLEALGVDVIWLAPFQPSPNKDNGYDVSDYYGVDPRHGSGGDFVEFVHQAKKRGFRVIMDLVVNHTSDQHPWFQEARKSPDSPKRHWYVWSKDRPPKWNQGMVFPGVQKATWTRDPVAKEYYFHRFYDHQPDLNMDHPEVREEVRRIMGFWLQLGVDGFRIDAVPFIIERPDPEGGGPLKELKFEYLEEMRTFQQWRSGDAVLLGEANVLPGQTAPYFRDGHGIHMMFNFWVNQHLFYALASGDVKPLSEALEATREVPPTCQWAHFLRNHDELDLGRLTDEQRALVFQRFGPDKSMQLYDRGIRRRLAPMLGSRAAIELAYSVLLALPGTPILRYGDEVGMGEDLSLDERDAVRTPMQWSTGKNAGFSAAEAKDLVHPVLSEGPYGCKQVCVEKQKRDEESLLRWTIRMLRLRKECPEIGWGSWQIVPVAAEGVLVLRYDWRGSALLTVHNFTSAPREVRLALEDRPRAGLLNLLVNEELEPDDGELSFVLEAQGFRWFRIGAADAALERGTEAPLTTPEEPPKKKPRKPPAPKKRSKR